MHALLNQKHVLWNLSFMKCKFRKSFLLIFMQIGGGCRGVPTLLNHCSLSPTSYPLSFHILAHSFAFFLHFLAPVKITTLFFSWDCALFDKNTRGWGTPQGLMTGLPASVCPPHRKNHNPKSKKAPRFHRGALLAKG